MSETLPEEEKSRKPDLEKFKEFLSIIENDKKLPQNMGE